jgi:hypothetical protein
MDAVTGVSGAGRRASASISVFRMGIRRITRLIIIILPRSIRLRLLLPFIYNRPEEIRLTVLGIGLTVPVPAAIILKRPFARKVGRPLGHVLMDRCRATGITVTSRQAITLMSVNAAGRGGR